LNQFCTLLTQLLQSVHALTSKASIQLKETFFELLTLKYWPIIDGIMTHSENGLSRKMLDLLHFEPPTFDLVFFIGR
ncbi:hypothetical protein T4E_3151, partial [Trichinella pseudospiralis]